MARVYKNNRIVVSITENEKTELMKLLNKKKQSVNEFLVFQITLFLKENAKPVIPMRKRGIRKSGRIEFRVSDWLYEEIEKKAKANNCSMSVLVRDVILKSLKNQK